MVFIETRMFTKLISQYLSDDEYHALQWYLHQRPDAGDIVKGSGGVRKVRWVQPGKGKRGGIRVVYIWKVSANEIWMLTLYSKNEKSTIPGHILKQIAQEIDNE